jgi:hypothetical protein
MKRLNIVLLVTMSLGFIGGLTGCSEIEFSKKAESICKADPSLCPVVVSLKTYTETIRYKQIDVLVINDNSGSMSAEQAEMGDRFPMFIDGLEDLDYRIGMITTDVSSTGNGPNPYKNGNGAYQDGKLLSFDSAGTKFLTPTLGRSAVIAKFRDAVVRDETIACDNSNYSPYYCPSGDERGIYAANLLIDANHSSFLRPSAHLAIIVLSDENTRSNGGFITDKPLENYDLVETLVDKMDTKFAGKKTFSVHSLVIQPGDTSCFSQQDQQTGATPMRAYYGYDFAELSDAGSSLTALGPILPGIKGSICESDYTSQLAEIAEKAKEYAEPVQLKCQPALDEFGQSTLRVTFNPAPVPPVMYSVNGLNQIVFSGLIPVNTQITYSYKCP